MISSPDTFTYPLICLQETDSTNRYLSHICNEQPETIAEFTTVTAEFQTAGKGQRGNSWEASKGKNLLFSFVLYPVFLEARRQFILSQIVSLSIKEELDQWINDVSIKWPNDIYWKDKKICGILIENDLSSHFIERSISGIGININQEEFYSNAPNPISLKQITGQEYNRRIILDGIMQRIQKYYTLLQTDETTTSTLISTNYGLHLFRREGLHHYEDCNGQFRAFLERVKPDGRLILKDEAGYIREYLFKEVKYVGNFPT
ncbi:MULTISPECIES: biotin--[acetyl-CoA-carboxylase] ligase [Bacteroides]|jgi:BirA family biotin operon repressor/biotin-[acetyl-CoA-carboxylase] ligase|uniref:biotin--[acetyl-CoA-carboxylase] ligase n=1 Tax=Bacteroides TaxID=816 RepID=UPI000C77E19B|nr:MULTISPECIES: biotin--[acetyl-CoA-carboxylase] ligase [Bacteroides]RGM48824.1 biotin--[acetyl-CoA-carboxylase] ligase [Bacteroides sp. OM08-11]